MYAVHATTHHVMWQRTQHLQQLQEENSEISKLQRTTFRYRNRALEKLATPVECPCPTEQHGCTLTFPIALIREHQDVCEYSPLVCPLQKLVNCNWKGHFEIVKHHVTQKHRNWVTKMSGMTTFLLRIKKKINYTPELFC